MKEATSLTGIYTFTKAKLEKPEHFALNDKIIKARESYILERSRKYKTFRLKKYKERCESLIKKLHSVCKTEITIVKNIIPTVGRTMIANNLTDATPDNTMLVNYAELGSGTNTPANSDVALQTAVYRNAIASMTNANNVAYMTAFYGATETTGTYNEAGLFSDGTSTLGTGILLSRVAINITKSNTESLTLDWELTIN